MVYHHALACISSKAACRLCISSHLSVCIKSFRNDDIQHYVLVIYNASHWWYARLRRDFCESSNSYAKTEKHLFYNPYTEKALAKGSAFSVIFPLRRVILLRSYIRLKPSYIALRAVLEANIISLQYHFLEEKISLRRRRNITKSKSLRKNRRFSNTPFDIFRLDYVRAPWYNQVS